MSKSIYALLIICITIFSCKKDDNSSMNDNSSSSFIGTWKIKQQFTNNQEQTIPECEQQISYIFNTNGSATENYYEGLTLESCIDYIEPGFWEQKSETTIIFNFIDGDPEDEIEFSLENNELISILFEAGDTYKNIYTKQ